MKKQSSLFKRCFSAIFYGVGGAAGSRILMFLANILLSRALGQEVFGQFSSLSGTVNLFVTFSGIGVSATLTRYVAATRDDGKMAGMYIRTLSSICCVMSMVLSASLFLFSDQISVLSTGVSTLGPYFKIVSFAVLFASMAAVEQSILVGYEMFRKSSVIQLARCAIFCGLGFVFSRIWGIYGAAVALLLSHIIQYILYFLANRNLFRARQVILSWKWTDETKEAAFSYAIPAFVSGLFVMPVNWLGNAMLTRTSGFTELAVFSVANQWMTYITYIPAQMGQMRPIYTDLYVRGHIDQLRKLMVKISITTTSIALVIVIAVTVFSKVVLSFYGAGYVAGQKTFVLMLLAAVLYTAQVQTGFILQTMKKMWVSVGINAAWGMILLSVYAILLNRGCEGYAVAYCAAYLVSLFIQMGLMKKYFKACQRCVNCKEAAEL